MSIEDIAAQAEEARQQIAAAIVDLEAAIRSLKAASSSLDEVASSSQALTALMSALAEARGSLENIQRTGAAADHSIAAYLTGIGARPAAPIAPPLHEQRQPTLRWVDQLEQLRRDPHWVSDKVGDVKTIIGHLDPALAGRWEPGNPIVTCPILAEIAKTLLLPLEAAKASVALSLRTIAGGDDAAARSTRTVIGTAFVITNELEDSASGLSPAGEVEKAVEALLPGANEIKIAANGLRIIGILLCVAGVDPSPHCECRADLLEDLGHNGIKAVL
jgi:hypothetical protein